MEIRTLRINRIRNTIAQVRQEDFRCVVDFNKCIVNALHHGNFEMLEWLNEEECTCNEYTFAFAAKCGNLEGMIWLKTNNCPWNEWTFIVAASYGEFEAMEWLKINECPMAEKMHSENCLGDATIVRWFTPNG